MNPTVTKVSDRSTLNLSDHNWKVLEDILPVLKPMADATEVLTKEDSPTLSQVVVLLHVLINKSLKVTSSDSGVAHELKCTIAKELCKRFKLREDGTPCDINSPALIATFCDPRYKSLSLLADRKEEFDVFISSLLEDAVDSTGIRSEQT